MFSIRKQIAQIGDIRNRLTVIAEPFKKPDDKTWWVKCRCSCGNETVTRERYFFTENTRSCGCLRNEASVRNGNEHRHKGWVKSRTHGESRTLLYGVWVQMKGRCDNPKNKGYHRYGGRGIKVCDEWSKSFLSFKGWALMQGYRQGLALDRVDVDKGYEPSNCRWVTPEENSRHMINGRMQQIADLRSRIQVMEAELKRRSVP